ncbi:MAG: hypothetical protein VX733_02795 [Candidatus Latescibacterota bacterium]|nr:hypothetical protein [Candidatus Latescibacterota bacterium]
MMAAGGIRPLRERLLEARRGNRRELVGEIVDGVHRLAGDGYRCCLVDYDRCRTEFFVRLLGFENDRIKAEFEFPLDPEVPAVQLVPLSHLADYDEVRDPYRIREIYEDMGEFIKRKKARIEYQRPLAVGGPAARVVGPGQPQAQRTPPWRRRWRLPVSPFVSSGIAILWAGVGLACTSSLILFLFIS